MRGLIAIIWRIFAEWMRGKVRDVELKFMYDFLNCFVEFIVIEVVKRILEIYMMLEVESRICKLKFVVGANESGFIQPYIISERVLLTKFDVIRILT